jgi:catechol 2,3-dioxygenase-like lactoylglutathione lyase family enzyme
MSLSSAKLNASVAVSDLGRAEAFYEGMLGLVAGKTQSDQSRVYACGGGTSLHLYESPTRADRGSATVATWYVTDLDEVVDELVAKGMTFERYDDPALPADDRGIHELDDGRVAWFQDPDGNTFAIEEGTAQ